jgi:hypothetical protein
VPLCNGAIGHQRTPAEILAAGEKLPPTRHYYLLSDFPASPARARTALVDRFCTTAVIASTADLASSDRLSCGMANHRR